MTRIQHKGANSQGGWVDINKDSGLLSDVYIQTASNGMSCKLHEVRAIIETLADKAGFKTDPTRNGRGIIIQFPESEAVQARRDELAQKFVGVAYEECGFEMKHAIEYIIDGEKQRGELK